MANTAVALIVAGTGTVSEAEVFDLLEDRYPPDDFEEVGLIVPVDKDLYTDAVKFAVKWFDDDANVIPVQTKGAALSRASAKLGDEPQKVEKFEAILNPDEFEDWDEVHFLVAVPDNEDDPDYDLYAELVEIAQENGIIVKDLTAGLDDVVLTDPEEAPAEPEPEPEPEPEKPARRSRARKKDAPEPDPVVAEEIAKIEDEVKPVGAAAEPTSTLDEDDQAAISEALEALSDVVQAMEKWDEAIALFDGSEVKHRPLTVKARKAFEGLASVGRDKTPAETEEPKDEAPKRGRGRPRENFEVRQILNEDDEWVPRPKGRLKNGTEWRTIHAETNEVLDSGIAGED